MSAMFLKETTPIRINKNSLFRLDKLLDYTYKQLPSTTILFNNTVKMFIKQRSNGENSECKHTQRKILTFCGRSYSI